MLAKNAPEISPICLKNRDKPNLLPSKVIIGLTQLEE